MDEIESLLKETVTTSLLALFLSLSLVGCADTPEKLENDVTETNKVTVADHIDYEAEAALDNQVYDPFEGINRTMWDLNYNYLDPYIARPAAIAYVDYVPVPVRSGLANFFANLEEPASMVNSLIMLNPENAATHFNRFWFNTVFGLGGLIDIATAANIPSPGQREFGDSLGSYGVGNGPYFMVPLYGPITLREGTGDIVDGLYFPLNLLTFWQSAGKWALEGLEKRAALVPQESILDDSPDPYIFTRDAYIQYKNFRATGGATVDEEPQEEAFSDEFLDEVDDD
ncbi:MlaA family lipoprotein [Photobacterium sanguinicancri]|uniref:MlaA family lipoprotein n=1 Tax=Photobacterium sanguinicancri TaxID=875932 RepID=UPI003D10C027